MVKVKSSLFVKCHTLKTYPAVNCAPCNGHVCGSGVTFLTLDLGGYDKSIQIWPSEN